MFSHTKEVSNYCSYWDVLSVLRLTGSGITLLHPLVELPGARTLITLDRLPEASPSLPSYKHLFFFFSLAMSNQSDMRNFGEMEMRV